MRTFIAINFDENTVDKIVGVQDELAERGRGNFTRRENLHLTLAFLGEIDVNQIEEVKSAMNAINLHSMNLTFGKVGYFRGDSELWWIGIDNNPTLLGMQRALINELKKTSVTPDMKKFRPHITLVRQMNIGHADIGFKPFTTKVSHISLMLSERVNGKLTYTELYSREVM